MRGLVRGWVGQGRIIHGGERGTRCIVVLYVFVLIQICINADHPRWQLCVLLYYTYYLLIQLYNTNIRIMYCQTLVAK